MKKSTIMSFCGFALLIYLVSGSVYAGTVTSMSHPILRESAEGESFKEVEVTCSHVSTARLIRKKQDSVEWCSALAANLCGNGKMAAAKNVCSNRFDSAIKEASLNSASPNSRSATATPAMNDQAAPAEPVPSSMDRISLEQEKIRLDEERLELRRKKLELQRRALEMEKTGG